MKKNVAFLSFGIGELTGGGGAERFFADLFDFYCDSKETRFKLHWLIDRTSIKHLNAVGKLKNVNNITELKIISNRFKKLLENMQILLFILRKRIHIVHIPWYNRYYISILTFIQKLPAFIRPKISINIVDCSLAFCYVDPGLSRAQELHEAYDPLFNEIKVDGYFAWNESFVSMMKGLFPDSKANLYAIRSRFCDTGNFHPSANKLNQIVFASRLTIFKNAEWFLEAVSYLHLHFAEELAGWQFVICGDGPLKVKLMQLAIANNIDQLVRFRIEARLQNVLNHSKCFVSCQDFDNFPSLSMAEAMAAGNVIVSRDVGQTHLFVKDNVNGFLAREDSAKGIAMAILKFIRVGDGFSQFSSHSVKLMKEVHTPANFITQIDEYWGALQ